MGFMDQALSEYRPPSADDMEIAIPTRREPKPTSEAQDVRDLGQHGGNAANAAAASENHDDAAGSAPGAEPTPQRDEPDEGEHTDSTEEQVAARAARAEATEESAAESAVAPATVDEPAIVEAQHEEAPPAPTPPQRPTAPRDLSEFEGTKPVEYKRIGFSAGADVPTVQLKPFPQPAIDKLRLMLAASAGGAFAEAVSGPQVVTAFLVATIGLELDLDENTAAAADAFRFSEPRLAAVEGRIEQLAAALDEVAGIAKSTRRTVSAASKITETTEFALAYLVADRVAHLSSTDVDETNVDVTQRKALTARETIRERASEQRTIEKQNDGRRMA